MRVKVWAELDRVIITSQNFGVTGRIVVQFHRVFFFFHYILFLCMGRPKQ